MSLVTVYLGEMRRGNSPSYSKCRLMANRPGGTRIPQLFGDDRLLVAEVHKVLYDRVGVWHVKTDFWQLVIYSLEALREKEENI